MKSPLITMSAITGKPTREDITSYMLSLKRCGIEQVMLYPRAGCEFTYLSEEWFCAIGHFIEAAKALDMAIWLYDEFNWPSGDAGGKVSAVERFRMKAVEITGKDPGKVFVCSNKSTNKGNCALFGEKYAPNLLLQEAVEYFIDCTHEAYYKRFKDDFGTIIKGFFTDEPAFSYCCPSSALPYYEGLETDYFARYGRQFFDDIKIHDTAFYERAVTLLSDKFNSTFITKIKKWCTEHGVVMTGHLLGDNTPFTATKNSGDFLKNLSQFGMPGIDDINTNFYDEGLLSLCGSVEYARGNAGAMAELFALGPCDMTYGTKRCMLYLMSCFKVDHYFLAVSHMDIRGNKKITDYFNLFTDDQPDFEGMLLLSEEAKKARKYAQKDFDADVYIRYPFAICSHHMNNELDILPFCHLINTLSHRQIQWKYLSETDEAPSSTPVVEFNETMQYRLGNEIITDQNEICKRLSIPLTVTDKSGNIPDNTFVRRFTDGSVVVLNLGDAPCTYLLNGKLITLDKHGVFTNDVPSQQDPQKVAAPNNYALTYGNHNIIRALCAGSNESCNILAACDLTVRFAVRNDVGAWLDDRTLSYNNDTANLSAGLKNLYKQSLDISLKQGIHHIKFQKDYRYLPSVFLMGDFAVNDNTDSPHLVLSGRKTTYKCGEFFSNFGKVEFSVTVTIPHKAKGIKIDGTDLYTCLFIDDVCIGKKICSPYVYEIDPLLQNTTVVLKIVQYSSIAPIFGDVAEFEKKENLQWVETPIPHKTRFGFTQVNWLL